MVLSFVGIIGGWGGEVGLQCKDVRNGAVMLVALGAMR
jgi:hypothetical protein